MSRASVDKAAKFLLQARHATLPLADLPSEAAPRTLAEAYAVQDVVRAALGPTIGWKTGAPSPTAEPIAAPLIQDFVSLSPAKLRFGDFNMVGLEAELAFKVGKDLPSRAETLDVQEVLDAVASLHAAIEVVDTRLPAWQDASALWKLADNQSNGFFVLGSGTESWRHLDLVNATVHLEVDGGIVADRRGGNAAGDPLRLLHWAVNHCCRHRGGLRCGDVITTGTYTGIHFLEGPADVHAEFPDIGIVEIHFIT